MNNIIVTEPSRNLRALGREALGGKWKLAVIATLVYYVAMLLPVEILDTLFGGAYGMSPLSGLYSTIVSGAFTLGYAMFCLSIFRNRNPEAAQVFYGFEHFGKAFCLSLVVGIFTFLWMLLFIVPGIIAIYRYSQVFYILADNPKMGIMDCINESKRLMVGNKWKLFCLQVSFIGWTILCSLPMGIVSGIIGAQYALSGYYYGEEQFLFNIIIYIASFGYLWMLPYLSVTSVGFYEMLTGNLRPGAIPATGSVVLEKKQDADTETYREENR